MRITLILLFIINFSKAQEFKEFKPGFFTEGDIYQYKRNTDNDNLYWIKALHTNFFDDMNMLKFWDLEEKKREKYYSGYSLTLFEFRCATNQYRFVDFYEYTKNSTGEYKLKSSLEDKSKNKSEFYYAIPNAMPDYFLKFFCK